MSKTPLKLAALLLPILALAWIAYQQTPGIRSKQLVEHAQEKIAEQAWPEAVIAMKKAVELYPNDRPSLWMLAETQQAAGDITGALENMAKALSLKTTPNKQQQQLLSFEQLASTSQQITPLQSFLQQQKDAEQWQLDFIQGRIYMMQKDYEKAIQAYKQAAKKKADLVVIKLNLAQAYMQADNTEQAKQIYQNVLDSDAHNISALHGLARSYAQEDNTQKALNAYIRVANHEQVSIAMLIEGANFALNKQHPNDALRHFITPLATDKRNAHMHDLLAMRAAIQENNDHDFFTMAAQQNLQKGEISLLLDECLRYQKATWGIKLLRQYSPQLDQRSKQLLLLKMMIAIQHYQEAEHIIASLGDSNERHIQAAALDIRTGRFAKAKIHLESILHSTSEAIWQQRAKQGLALINSLQEEFSHAPIEQQAQQWLLQGEAQKVLQAYQQQANPSLTLQLLAVAALQQLDRQQEARTQLQKIKQQHPNNEAVYLLWGRSAGKEKPLETLKALQQASHTAANGPRLQSLIGELQAQSKQTEQAIQTWLNVTQTWPTFLISQVLLAQTYMQTQQWHLAQGVWENILRQQPNDANSQNNLAYCLMKQGEKSKALSLIKQALLLQADNAAMLDTLKEIQNMP